ncbi:hypothetical protein RHMOL_Rhmol10G0161200 [Rhododendron molle]|uniref:Uncharacterized protein n=1 Tax=Rhododendron molle TaxID=49168 RepID=A0ACC0M3Y0_RHOML|nr:hypothetical protein RHMOL_Rhmol10G0161200 [Rhododendron molle]
MTSLCGVVHIISTNRKEGNIHPLKWRVNKTQLDITPCLLILFCLLFVRIFNYRYRRIFNFFLIIKRVEEGTEGYCNNKNCKGI